MLRLYSIAIVCGLALFVTPTTGWADDPPALVPAPSATPLQDSAGGAGQEPRTPNTWYEDMVESLKGGDVEFNLRLRAEFADEKGLEDANAWTSSFRLGYRTAEYEGWHLFGELEDVRAIDDRTYNAGGTNGHHGRTSIADPEVTNLNQAYVNYKSESWATYARAGRQRITLDDHRFVGDVGWRQNDQTFDAFKVANNSIEDLEIMYAFIWDVNRIFGDEPATGTPAATGPTSTRDFESESHIFHVSYSGLSFLNIAAFAYFLDFSGRNATATVNSSNTLGFRLNGRAEINEHASIGYTGSYAHQVDAEDNPLGYKANYWFLEGDVDVADFGRAFLGFEVLGSDNGRAVFTTPLATGHKFNGWADSFLDNGGVKGLQDAYLGIAPELPYELISSVVYHKFQADDGGANLGWEIDASLGRKLTDHVTGLLKVAYFDGKAMGDPEIWRFWAQTEISF